MERQKESPKPKNDDVSIPKKVPPKRNGSGKPVKPFGEDQDTPSVILPKKSPPKPVEPVKAAEPAAEPAAKAAAKAAEPKFDIEAMKEKVRAKLEAKAMSKQHRD